MDACQTSRQDPIAANEAQHWRVNYEQLCAQADAQELPPIVFFKANRRTGRATRSKERNLLDRLILHRDAVLAFAFEVDVPFTNNQAERDLRPAKLKQGGEWLLSD